MLIHEIKDSAPKRGLANIRIEPLHTKTGFKPTKEYYKMSFVPNLHAGGRPFSVLTRQDIILLVDDLLKVIADE